MDPLELPQQPETHAVGPEIRLREWVERRGLADEGADAEEDALRFVDVVIDLVAGVDDLVTVEEVVAGENLERTGELIRQLQLDGRNHAEVVARHAANVRGLGVDA